MKNFEKEIKIIKETMSNAEIANIEDLWLTLRNRKLQERLEQSLFGFSSDYSAMRKLWMGNFDIIFLVEGKYYKDGGYKKVIFSVIITPHKSITLIDLGANPEMKCREMGYEYIGGAKYF